MQGESVIFSHEDKNSCDVVEKDYKRTELVAQRTINQD